MHIPVTDVTLHRWGSLSPAEQHEVQLLARGSLMGVEAAMEYVLVAHGRQHGSTLDHVTVAAAYRQAGLRYPGQREPITIDAPLVISVAARTRPTPRQRDGLTRRERKALKARQRR